MLVDQNQTAVRSFRSIFNRIMSYISLQGLIGGFMRAGWTAFLLSVL